MSRCNCRIGDECPCVMHVDTIARAEKAEAAHVRLVEVLDEALAQGNKATAERDQLRELLREDRFFKHSATCSSSWIYRPDPCDCGLDSWRDRVKKELEGT